MVKRVNKRKSSARRVSTRPLSFWQFIRKNFLIIAGLLLLPITVGAVISSYNYANQSSAANFKKQTSIFQGKGTAAKPPSGRTLKTQGSCGITDTVNKNTLVCYGDIKQCEICTESGSWRACRQDEAREICNVNQGYIGDQVGSGEATSYKEGCYEDFSGCQNGRAICNFGGPKCPAEKVIVGYLCNNPENKDDCTPAETVEEKKSCPSGNGGTVSHGTKAWSGSDCRICNNGNWDPTGATDCPAIAADNPAYNPPPQAEPPREEPQEKPQENSGGGICGWACAEDGGTGKCPDGFTERIPDIQCDSDKDGQGNICGKKCGVGTARSAGFDVGKAIKNFFGGLFGW